MKIALGCDQNAYQLKEIVKNYLIENGHEVVDYGCYSCDAAVDYPDVAFQVAKDIAARIMSRGILICGTGIGVAIAAGKVPGIRAALCHDTYSAERAQKSNNAQVLTMGAQIIGPQVALKVVEAWVSSEFTGGPSEAKVQKIIDQEKIFLKGVNYEEAN